VEEKKAIEEYLWEEEAALKTTSLVGTVQVHFVRQPNDDDITVALEERLPHK